MAFDLGGEKIEYVQLRVNFFRRVSAKMWGRALQIHSFIQFTYLFAVAVPSLHVVG